jgi:purine-binding chemotaxis protein CheW
MASSTTQRSTGTAGTALQGNLSGKYLTFCLQQEIYGLAILKVQEIIGIMPVTQVPRMPPFVRGVVNLRGRIIPVIDLRIHFGLKSQDDTSKTCIIVVQIEREDHRVTMGIIVDEVAEVIDLKAEQIEPAPSFGVAVNTDFILGMGKANQKVIMLLDIDQVLSVEQAGLISQTAQAE